MKLGTTTARDMYSQSHRLDASYHASEGGKALRFISGWAGQPQQSPQTSSLVLKEARVVYNTQRVEKLAQVCIPGGIFVPGRFKRYYVNDPEHGERWLSPSDMLKADLSNLSFVSRKYTPSIDTLRIHKGWLLLSRSGTIGNCVYVREDMDRLIGSDDIIRIIADTSKIPAGYLYAFINSPIGQALIQRQTYGAVIQHIETEHVLDLPILRLDMEMEASIHTLVEQASALRVKALHHKQQAEDLIATKLDINVYIGKKQQWIAVSRNDLGFRLEGAYHTARVSVEQSLSEIGIELVPLDLLLLDIFYLGKLHRIFVDDPKHGVPLLSISEAQRAKITSYKFISATRSRNVDKARLEKGHILVSRSGTPGLITYVREEMVGMAGSDHLVRLVTDSSQLLSGYLYAFLSSPLGKILLIGASHGSVQLELPPEYIKKIRVPLLSLDEQQPIHDLIEEFGDSLTEASRCEDEAQRIMLEALNWQA